jgi:hypothetical protein
MSSEPAECGREQTHRPSQSAENQPLSPIAPASATDQTRGRNLRLDSCAVCIDALQFAFKMEPAAAVAVLGQILANVGESISVVTGGEEAAQIMETIHADCGEGGGPGVPGVNDGEGCSDRRPSLSRG